MRLKKGSLVPLAAAILLLAGGLPAARAHSQQGGDEACDNGAAPGEVPAVKAVVTDSKSVEIIWLPPTTAGCFSSFTVTGKDVGTGKGLPARGVSDALQATYSDLWPGATYEFSVTAGGPGGKGGSRSTRVALPPAFLDTKPDAPERLAAVAVSDSQALVTWGAPAGNPKVDAWELSIVPVNATGFPLSGSKSATYSVDGSSKEFTARGLQPSAFYVFTVVAKSNKGVSPEPALAFFGTPNRGAGVPDAPRDLQAQPAGEGTLALRWQAPWGSPPDYYQIGITEVDGSGKRLSDTSVIPNANTTALVRDLNPGATYEISVQAYSVAYNAGKTSRITFTVPWGYQPSQALSAAPGNMQAQVYGGDIELIWAPVPGAEYYAISLFDAYSGRSLGINYETRDNAITFGGLPIGQAVQVVVQGVAGGYYSPPASAVVEIPPPASGYYHSPSYSPYYGYNAYLPFWYARWYPTGYYNHWHPGQLVLTSAVVAAALSPFNHFWGGNWWAHRPRAINPLRPLTPFRPLRPWGGSSTWGWANSALRPRPGGGGGGFGGIGGIPNRLPGQRPAPSGRPPILDNIIRPSTRPLPNRPPGVPSFPGFPRPGGNNGGGSGTPPIPGIPGFPRPGGNNGGSNTPSIPGIPGFPRPGSGGGNTPSIPGPRPGGADNNNGGGSTPSTPGFPRPGSSGGNSPSIPGFPRPGWSGGAPSNPIPRPWPAPAPAPAPSIPQPRPNPGRDGLFGGGGGWGGNGGRWGGSGGDHRGGNGGGWGGNGGEHRGGTGGGWGGNGGGWGGGNGGGWGGGNGGGFGGGGFGGGGFGGGSGFGNRGGGLFGRRHLL